MWSESRHTALPTGVRSRRPRVRDARHLERESTGAMRSGNSEPRLDLGISVCIYVICRAKVETAVRGWLITVGLDDRCSPRSSGMRASSLAASGVDQNVAPSGSLTIRPACEVHRDASHFDPVKNAIDRPIRNATAGATLRFARCV